MKEQWITNVNIVLFVSAFRILSLWKQENYSKWVGADKDNCHFQPKRKGNITKECIVLSAHLFMEFHNYPKSTCTTKQLQEMKCTLHKDKTQYQQIHNRDKAKKVYYYWRSSKTTQRVHTTNNLKIWKSASLAKSLKFFISSHLPFKLQQHTIIKPRDILRSHTWLWCFWHE